MSKVFQHMLRIRSIVMSCIGSIPASFDWRGRKLQYGRPDELAMVAALFLSSVRRAGVGTDPLLKSYFRSLDVRQCVTTMDLR